MEYKFDKKGNIVRLRDDVNHVIGSGVLYYEKNLGEQMYLFTAAHCLYRDCDRFKDLLDKISVEIYSYENSQYESITINKLSEQIAHSSNRDIDLAVIVLNKIDVEAINPNLSTIEIVNSAANLRKMQLLGFPKANEHKEVLPNNLELIDERISEQQFFVNMEQGIDSFYLRGYSGGAIFINTETDENILIGLFVRSQKDEERGHIGYGQYLRNLNIILEENRLKKVSFGYFGIDGLTHKKISRICEKSKSNLTPDYGIQVKSNVEPYLDAICRNNSFIIRYRDSLKKWFQESYIYRNSDTSIVSSLEIEFNELKSKISEYINGYDLSIPNEIDFSDCICLIKAFKEKLDNNIDILYQQHSALKKNADKQEKEKLDNEISRLYKLEGYSENFLEAIDDTYYSFANNSIAILEGEAGCGKSFMLGNLSMSLIEEGVPVILLLGRDFNGQESIEWNIKKLIGIEYDFDSFLSNSNKIAIERNQRFMFLIDAINETVGRGYWKDNLCAFVDTIKKFPAIGLILSIRTTYYNDEIPKEFKDDKSIEVIHHNGLEGNEDEAIRLYCDFYKLVAPTLPMLNPEYSNPLMLHILCRVAKERYDGKFIMVQTGISSLFDEYRRMYDKEFGEKKDIYKGRRVVSKSLYCIANEMFITGKDSISYDCCDKILFNNVGNFSTLLNDLINSGILSKDVIYGEEEECVRFTYQRFVDYYIAYIIVEKCKTELDIKIKFADTIFKEKLYKHVNVLGIIEQLAILLPERFKLELWEVLDVSEINYFYKTNAMILFESLAWRSKESVDLIKIKKLLEKVEFNYNEYLNTLVLLAPIPNHPLNSDYWHTLMKKYDLPNREQILQKFLLEYSIIYKEPVYSYIDRLIEWSWKKSLSAEIDDEVARLVGQMMAWFLSSTINSLRDKTTKAMVNILQAHSKSLIAILKAFEGVDDPYIQERIFAVAYGCILRTKDINDKRKIGEYVYNYVFVNSNIPKHILTRDYMCNIVDYAVKVANLEGVDMNKVLPPYNEEMPVFPSKEDIDVYKIPYESEVPFKYAQNCIINSLVEGLSDFGDKIVSPRVGEFCAWSFRIEEAYTKFKKKLSKNKRTLLEYFEQIIEFVESSDNDILYELTMTEEQKSFREVCKNLLPSLSEDFNKIFDKNDADKIINVYVPNHLKRNSNRYSCRIDELSVKYWIVKRVFELGYNKDLHGKYDERVKRIEDYRLGTFEFGRVERIGKKYEWIALYEILGCISDNHYIFDTENSEPNKYIGAWQTYVRNIDPGCITRRTADFIKPTWHEYNFFPYWNQEINLWLEASFTLVEIQNILKREDDNGIKWFTLYDYNTVYEPQKIGRERWIEASRSFNICVFSYIIKKEDKCKLIEETAGKNYIELNMLEFKNTGSHIISREKYWSRAFCNDIDKNIKDSMQPIYKGCNVNGIYTIEEMNGNIEDDCSGTPTRYYMPIRSLQSMLNATYADEDGLFINDKDEVVICCNPNSQRICHTLIHRDRLLDVLRMDGLDIVWIVDVEKSYNSRVNAKMNYRRTMSCGLFYLDDKGNISGTMKIHNDI